MVWERFFLLLLAVAMLPTSNLNLNPPEGQRAKDEGGKFLIAPAGRGKKGKEMKCFSCEQTISFVSLISIFEQRSELVCQFFSSSVAFVRF